MRRPGDTGQASARVLFAVAEYAEFTELWRVVPALRESLAVSPLFFFVKSSYRRMEADTALLQAAGLAWLDHTGRVHGGGSHHADAPASPRARHRLPPGAVGEALRRGARLLRERGLRGLREIVVDTLNLRAALRVYADRLERMRRVLAVVRPRAVLLGQEVVGGELSLLAQAAREAGVPVLVLPFAMFNREEFVGFARARSGHAVEHGWLNGVVARCLPRWQHDDGARRFLRLEGYRVLALEWLGVVEGDPWMACTGAVGAVAVDSAVRRAACARDGIPDERMEITGIAVHDVLAAHLRERGALRRRLGLREASEGAGAVVLCAWPPCIDAWAGGPPPGFRDYQALAGHWAAALATVRDRHAAQVLVKPHPKSLPEEVAAAEAAGLRVLDEDTAALLAASDLLVTTASSVTAWAVAATRPVIDYDCYGTGYSDFEGVPGVLAVSGAEAFADCLDRLCGDPGLRAELASAQRQVAAGWGVLDGGAGRRLVDFVARHAGLETAARRAETASCG